MSATPLSLLDRLQRRPEDESWKRFVDLYAPLLRAWLRRCHVTDADADDLTQEVLAVVVRELPRFRIGRRPGSFRRWLRTVTVHRLRDFWRSRRYRPLAPGGDDFQELLEQLEAPDSGLGRLWDLEHQRHVARRLLDAIRADFTPTTWQAFRRVVTDGVRPADAAAELGLSVNAVLLAKSHVLRRLREEGRGLLD
jgi:RNA polymerase sigma-70 factor (ECF subfamily)